MPTRIYVTPVNIIPGNIIRSKTTASATVFSSRSGAASRRIGRANTIPRAADNAVSKNITVKNEEEKIRLTNIVRKYLPGNCGAIIRTSAENQSEYVIKNDTVRFSAN